MTVLVWLIPIALLLGLAGLGAFLWSLKSGQYDDLEGAANRILFDDDGNGGEDGEAEGEPGGKLPEPGGGEPRDGGAGGGVGDR